MGKYYAIDQAVKQAEKAFSFLDDDLVSRLKKRAEIRRSISTRKSVQEGKPDRIADLLEEAAAALSAYKGAAPLCDKHQPKGGTRGGCLVCAIARLEYALSRIDYLCGPPNEMGISGYDCYYDEEVVVKNVAAMKNRLENEKDT